MRVFVLMISFMLCGSSCKKNNVEVVNHVYNATMKVSVYNQLVTGGQVNNIPVKDARVDLYETKYDLDNSQNLIVSHITDSVGVAPFYNLLLSHYYIRASHPAYGQLTDETSTPDGSVSFVEFLF